MATLRELAEITGYSIATISRVLNKDATLKVTEDTRNAILDAVERTGYGNGQNDSRRNMLGEHLKVGIVEKVSLMEAEKNPYYLYLKNSVEKSCFSYGIETFVMQYDRVESCYRCAAPRELDGIFAIGQFTAEEIAVMRRSSSQIVFLDSSPFPGEFCSVVPDYEAGICQGTEYLIQRGHRKIVFVGPEFTEDSLCRPYPERRREVFRDYAAHCGKDIQTVLLDTERLAGDVVEKVEEYVKGLSGGAAKPTAFFTYNDPTAIGVLRAFELMGYRVPEDFSVLSYNDTAFTDIMKPQLSSVCINIEEMAENAVWIMKRLVRKENMVPVKISVSSVLKVRESVKMFTDFGSE